jgi:uncharacterized protein (TIGR02145 family)
MLSFTDTSDIEFEATADEQTVGINSNIEWQIENSAPEWLTVSPSTGIGNSTITVNAAANDATLRTATLTLSAVSADVADQTINVSQLAALSGDGVTINGLTWAAANLESDGVFAAGIEDKGSFFQFNRKAHWANTGSVTGWNSSAQETGDWLPENDPCPEGWQVPTDADFKSLLTSSNRRIAGQGQWIGANASTASVEDPKGCIFLPVAGLRSASNGSLSAATGTSAAGWYWTSTSSGDAFNTAFFVRWTTAKPAVTSSMTDGNKNKGHLIRCVKK